MGTTFRVETLWPALRGRSVCSAKERFAVVYKRRLAQPTDFKIEAISEHSSKVLADGYCNGFLNAAMTAFANHHPVSFSPDHFWILVLQAVSQHVNGNAEALRSKFVRHEGKIALRVRRDNFLRGSPLNDWVEVVREFAQQIDANLAPGVADRLSARFGTTGLNEELASRIAVMEMCKTYFDYTMLTMCGIPSVTLEGSLEDWETLCQKSEELVREMCLPSFSQWWLPILMPVLEKVAASARGDVDADFWQSFVKRGSTHGSGAHSFISGWINCLFPFVGNGAKNVWCQPYKAGADWVRYAQGKTWERNGPFGKAWGPNEDAFPKGLAEAPVVWSYLGSEIQMQFVSGFLATSQHPKTLALRPEIGWAIIDPGR